MSLAVALAPWVKVRGACPLGRPSLRCHHRRLDFYDLMIALLPKMACAPRATSQAVGSRHPEGVRGKPVIHTRRPQISDLRECTTMSQKTWCPINTLKCLDVCVGIGWKKKSCGIIPILTPLTMRKKSLAPRDKTVNFKCVVSFLQIIELVRTVNIHREDLRGIERTNILIFIFNGGMPLVARSKNHLWILHIQNQ
jgi:hypothetical protein